MRLFGVAAALAASLGLGGCFQSSLAGLPGGAVDLSGQWILDAAASDDALALIRAATPAPARPPPQGPDPCALLAPSAGGQRGGNSRAGNGNSGGPNCAGSAQVEETGPRLRPADRAQFVRSVIVPPEVIVIGQQAEHFSLTQGERHRTFEPGQSDPVSVTDRYGTRRVRAGWSGREFVIRSEDRNRVVIEERLRAGAAPDTLEAEVTLSAWNYHKIHERIVYRRADSGRVPLPAADGPPLRGSH